MLEIDVDGLSGLLSGLLINYSSIKKNCGSCIGSKKTTTKAPTNRGPSAVKREKTSILRPSTIQILTLLPKITCLRNRRMLNCLFKFISPRALKKLAKS
jgi:hypothetical protein